METDTVSIWFIWLLLWLLNTEVHGTFTDLLPLLTISNINLFLSYSSSEYKWPPEKTTEKKRKGFFLHWAQLKYQAVIKHIFFKWPDTDAPLFLLYIYDS